MQILQTILAEAIASEWRATIQIAGPLNETKTPWMNVTKDQLAAIINILDADPQAYKVPKKAKRKTCRIVKNLSGEYSTTIYTRRNGFMAVEWKRRFRDAIDQAIIHGVTHVFVGYSLDAKAVPIGSVRRYHN